MSATGKKAAGGMEYLRGKVLWMRGKLTHNRSMQARGVGRQAKGGVKYETGKAQGATDKFTDR